MEHVFHRGQDASAPTLLLLHGTGGTEHDLVGIGRTLSPGSSLLGVRGQVSERGMARFFRRLAEGVFDEEDLVFRTRELTQRVDELAAQYEFDRSRVVAVGYSNGANIAASMLFHSAEALHGAILFHPMVPLRGIALPSLEEIAVFIGAGRQDPLCPPEETNELASLLRQAQADVTVHWEPSGHQLTGGEIQQAADWFGDRYGKGPAAE